ncbi:MAG: VacJ family lipoprotein, partial [Desulfobacteraceae bacterium]
PDTEGDGLPMEDRLDTIADPLEPINRVFFEFNDKLYFWFLKPVATGYKVVVPEPARVSVRNFFQNLSFPVHFLNCLLQGKVEGAFMEMGRFLLNTAVGAAGLIDVATKSGMFKKYEEDLGQTFGFHGLGPGLYINWPVFGPSSLRDTIGMVGDGFLEPLNYVDQAKYRAAIRGFQVINQTSLTIGDYEDLKRAALDPYIALRDAYYQNRKSKIKE